MGGRALQIGLVSLLSTSAFAQPIYHWESYPWGVFLQQARKNAIEQEIEQTIDEFERSGVDVHAANIYFDLQNETQLNGRKAAEYAYRQLPRSNVLADSINFDVEVTAYPRLLRAFTYHELQHFADKQMNKLPVTVQVEEELARNPQYRPSPPLIHAMEMEAAASEVRAYTAELHYLERHRREWPLWGGGEFSYRNVYKRAKEGLQRNTLRLADLQKVSQ